jgi:DNA-binding XRE family transcriptional regulator
MRKKQYASSGTKQSVEAVEKIAGASLTFRAALKSSRLAEEMTQDELGKEIGVSRQYIHQLETGARSPSVEQAVKLANVFGMIQDQFVELALQNQIEKAGIKKKVVSLKKIS